MAAVCTLISEDMRLLIFNQQIVGSFSAKVSFFMAYFSFLQFFVCRDIFAVFSLVLGNAASPLCLIVLQKIANRETLRRLTEKPCEAFFEVFAQN